MPKVVPLQSFMLSGREGPVVYCIRGGKCFTRKWVQPKDPRSLKQIERRGRFQAAIDAWKKMDSAARAPWRERAKYMKRTGYHLFVAEFIAGPGKQG